MLYEVTKLSSECSHEWRVSRAASAYPRDIPQVYCTVHGKRMIPREDASITRMCILATLPLSCIVTTSCVHIDFLYYAVVTHVNTVLFPLL